MIETRFLTGFKSEDTDTPGLVREEDGTIWQVHPDGSRTELSTGGGGGGAGTGEYAGISLVETPGAGTYSGAVELPAGALITLVSVKTTVTWDADSVVTSIGVTSNSILFQEADIKNQGENVILPVAALAPYDATGEAEFTVSASAVGAGGSSGRAVVLVGYSVPPYVVATKS